MILLIFAGLIVAIFSFICGAIFMFVIIAAKHAAIWKMDFWESYDYLRKEYFGE